MDSPVEQRMQTRLERLSVFKANVYHVGRTNTPLRISQVTNVLRPLDLGNLLDGAFLPNFSGWTLLRLTQCFYHSDTKIGVHCYMESFIPILLSLYQ